jgi:hypothetical protein
VDAQSDSTNSTTGTDVSLVNVLKAKRPSLTMVLWRCGRDLHWRIVLYVVGEWIALDRCLIHSSVCLHGLLISRFNGRRNVHHSTGCSEHLAVLESPGLVKGIGSDESRVLLCVRSLTRSLLIQETFPPRNDSRLDLRLI